MNFFQIDPRPVGRGANEKFFSENSNVLGIEVTIPEWASRCSFGNIDHHGSQDTAETPSACEQAIKYGTRFFGRPCCGGGWDTYSCPKCDGADCPPVKPEAIVTVRPDADSVTAMAVVFSCLLGGGREIDRDLVKMVGTFDRLGHHAEQRDDRVVAIARVSADFKRSLTERVAWVQGLLAGNSEQMAEVAELVAERDKEFAEAKVASEINLVANGRIATVVSSHRFATNLGYEYATVVVAQNPEMPVNFRDPFAGTYNKFTVCRYNSHTPCNLPAALAELQVLEPGWGGRGDIFGSPQGVNSKLTLNQVVEVVQKHLK
ncbi:hypothetical protein KKC83_03000 [Patescibacteria group bacterium]|nr:hypothetical protein [Candidatus Falkowbacteria bacterium]MBU3905709.1 hypothetical protein [Patescibacteria group bacterium]MCG2698098.1 hypothetical protein [Candidatus Parcubacteria bacterium]MBU4014861.1 hypothetical protein [Patescibacteria group bacterium]MBU4026483.1 hypothetical protein [Patescibacteria group bacterium]